MGETQEHMLQELLGEIKLVEKRITKEGDNLEKAVISDTDRPSFGYDESTKKFDINIAKKYMQGKVDSYKALVVRLQDLRTLRDQTNMDTRITVDGTEMTIYGAIMLRDILSKKLKFMYDKLIESEKTINNMTAGMSIRRERNTKPIETIPLINMEKVKEEAMTFDSLINHLDSTLTIANSTTKVQY